MKTTFGNLQEEVEIDEPRARTLVSSLAREEGVRGREVTLVFVDDSYIRELKGRYMGVRRATDVLAFPLAENSREEAPGETKGADRRRPQGDGAAAGGPPPEDLLGEVYISTQRAIDQARRNHVGLSEEIARLIVHGLLHLFGYRDDSSSSRREMIRRQESFLREHKGTASAVAKRVKDRRKDGAWGRGRRASSSTGRGSSSV